MSTAPGDQQLGRKATRGVAWFFLRAGVIELLIFPTSMVLARLLTPQEFGIAAAATFFTMLAERASELGFNAAIVRAKKLTSDHLSTVFVVNLVVGLLMYLGLVALAPTVSRFYDVAEAGAILPVAAIGFLIVPFGTVPAALLAKDMRFKETTMIAWVQAVTQAVATLWLAWLGFSFMSLVYGRLAALTAMTLSRLSVSTWRPRLTFSMPALREIFSFGAGVHAKRLLDTTAQNIDNVIVGKVLGMTALGFYDKAYAMMYRCLGRLNAGGPAVTFAAFSVINEEPERFRRAYKKVLMSTSLLAFPVFGILIAVAPRFMTVLFGEPWRAAAAPFQVLCVVGCFKLLNSYASSATQAVGSVWSEVWRQVLYIGMIIGGIFALKSAGPLGAAVGVVLATFVMTVLMHLLLMKTTGLNVADVVMPQVPATLCAVGAAMVALGLDLYVTRSHPQVPAWLLLGVQMSAAVMFSAAFVLFAPLTSLRQLVRDVADDLAPQRVKQQRWFAKLLHA